MSFDLEELSMRLITAFILLYMCASTMAADEPNKKVGDFLGADIVEILNNATKVEVFRVQREAKPGDEAIGGYKITGKGKEQGKDFVAGIRAIAFDEKTYNFESAKLCEFDPGVAYKFISGEKSCVLLLCFVCKELQFQFEPKEGKKFHAHEDFDNRYAELLKLAKQALPDDKEIQALK
jgi:hypothetical protein